jgi:hypothetical protein
MIYENTPSHFQCFSIGKFQSQSLKKISFCLWTPEIERSIRIEWIVWYFGGECPLGISPLFSKKTNKQSQEMNDSAHTHKWNK